MLGGCFPANRETHIPIPHTTYSANSSHSYKCLVVALPGYGDAQTKFKEEGFIKALRSAAVRADFVTVDAHFGYYREGSTVERVYQDVLLPAKRSGYQRIWIVGTSMGGLGTLGMAALHGEILDGALLLAPYLGDDDVIKEIRKAGGLNSWNPVLKPAPPNDPDTFFRHVWHWAKTQKTVDGSTLPVYLGFGKSDDLAPANRMLGQALPKRHVRAIDGGHGWVVWRRLWREFLESGLLQQSCNRNDQSAGASYTGTTSM